MAGKKTMETPLVDFSFIYEMAGNDTQYMYDIINLYLSTFPEKLNELEKQVKETDNYVAIEKLVHFLKSGSSVIKIRDMYDGLVGMEILAKAQAGKEGLLATLDNILTNFRQAMPLLVAEREKYRN